MKKSNIHVNEVLEEKGQENGGEKVFEEIMAENFSGLLKNIILHIKSSVDPSGINADKTTPRHIIVKLLKTKSQEKILTVIKRKIKKK